VNPGSDPAATLHAHATALPLHPLPHPPIGAAVEPLGLVAVTASRETLGMTVHPPGVPLHPVPLSLQALTTLDLVTVHRAARLRLDGTGEQCGRAERGEDESAETLHGALLRRGAASMSMSVIVPARNRTRRAASR